MSRRRGRPNQEEGPAITRQELLRLAARAIGRDGLARASMRGIAREAGVSLSTLQNRFRTKEVLWKAVIDEVIAPAEDRDYGDVPDPESFFTEVVHERLGNAVKHPGLVGRLLVDGVAGEEVLLEHLARATHELRERDRQRVRFSVEVGALRAVDVDALMALMGIALPVLSSSKGAIERLIGPDLDDDTQRAELADAIADIILYGVMPRERDPEGQ